MTQVEHHRSIQRLCQRFNETADLAEKLEIRKQQKVMLRQYPIVPLTTFEKYSDVIAQGEEVLPLKKGAQIK